MSEREDSNRTPATFVNRFFVSVSPTVTRIAFAEGALGGGGDMNYRSAVMMQTSDAKDLLRVMSELIAEHEAKMALSKEAVN